MLEIEAVHADCSLWLWSQLKGWGSHPLPHPHCSHPPPPPTHTKHMLFLSLNWFVQVLLFNPFPCWQNLPLTLTRRESVICWHYSKCLGDETLLKLASYSLQLLSSSSLCWYFLENVGSTFVIGYLVYLAFSSSCFLLGTLGNTVIRFGHRPEVAHRGGLSAFTPQFISSTNTSQPPNNSELHQAFNERLLYTSVMPSA